MKLFSPTISHSEEETEALGRVLGQACQGGEVFALIGDLGAGKTRFSKGLAAGLGVSDRVNSPTFNILKIYKAKNTKGIRYFCHADAYRLDSPVNIENIGFSEYWGKNDCVCAIEWADNIRQHLPKNTIKIKFSLAGEDSRCISIDKK